MSKPPEIAPEATIVTPAVMPAYAPTVELTPWEQAERQAKATQARLDVLFAEVQLGGRESLKQDPDFHYIFIPADPDNEHMVRRRFAEGGWEVVREGVGSLINTWVLRIRRDLKTDRYQKALSAFNAVVGILSNDRLSQDPNLTGGVVEQVLTEEDIRSRPSTSL